MIYEVWIAGELNGTKLGIEASSSEEEIVEFLTELLTRKEVAEVGIRKYKEDGDA